MSELKPESKKLHEAINKAMKSDDFYDTILEAAQAKQIDQLQKKLTDRDLLLTKEHKRCKKLKAEITELKEKAKGRDELINRWHGEAKELEEANRWIPASERLPDEPTNEDGTPILVIKNDDVGVMWLFPNSNWRDSFNYMGYTHWMSVPTLPESEDKESKENAEN